jgi:glutathione synthase
MKHLFVIDPPGALNFKLDTSLHIAQALLQRGEEVFVCEPSHLFLKKTEKMVYAKVKRLGKFNPELAANPITLTDELETPLSSLSSVHMRKDPPFDISYIMVTWILDFIPSPTRIFNNPKALRSLNEKLLILRFPNLCADALFSANPDQLLEFAERTPNTDAILKPIDLYGGRGVLRLDLKKAGRKKIQDLLFEETSNGSIHRLIQPFNPSVFDGEVRSFYAGGSPIAWCLKKPSNGNYLANTREGATLHSFDAPQQLVAKTNHIAKELLKDGVYFVGFDIIGEEISEINITSPRLLVPPGHDKAPYFEKIVDDLITSLSVLK